MIEVLVVAIAILASVSYLIWKIFFQKSKSCGGGCGCSNRPRP